MKTLLNISSPSSENAERGQKSENPPQQTFGENSPILRHNLASLLPVAMATLLSFLLPSIVICFPETSLRRCYKLGTLLSQSNRYIHYKFTPGHHPSPEVFVAMPECHPSPPPHPLPPPFTQRVTSSDEEADDNLPFQSSALDFFPVF
ncbi:hypothetical protein CEXT_551131 [Caerostris extrusa]|uniref:Uncharacterized protein n=1 Tax=Caerostris extrusa TaxID=172846 RepID=A0AAV4RKV5_CAEEX|nr:hypothetical protein CEXT_551131 [Caerostris extrusa]